MTASSSCRTAPALTPRHAGHPVVAAMTGAWSRFIRLRQARHLYFRMDVPVQDDGSSRGQITEK